jgi:hypothetical protein
MEQKRTVRARMVLSDEDTRITRRAAPGYPMTDDTPTAIPIEMPWDDGSQQQMEDYWRYVAPLRTPGALYARIVGKGRKHV